MKLMTYNQRFGGTGNRHWLHVIEAFNPDILLAQESFAPEQCGLSQDLREQAVWHPVITEKSGALKWGTAVYAKCGKVTALKVNDFRGVLAGVEIEGLAHPGPPERCLRVFSVHAPTDKGWTSTINSVKEILDAIAENEKRSRDADLIIGGDFNFYSLGERLDGEMKDGKPWKTKPEEKEILDRLHDKFELINCWQSANPGKPLAQTFRRYECAIHCDGIFVPKSWEASIRSCDVVDTEMWARQGRNPPPDSDHNPVLASFDKAG